MSLSHPESRELTRRIIGASIEVHRHFGPGLLESAYDEALYVEMLDIGLRVERQRSIPLIYKSRVIQTVLRPDMIVDRLVIVEVKAVEKTLPVHKSQVLTYMRMAEIQVGLLLNFNVAVMTDGITRLSL